MVLRLSLALASLLLAGSVQATSLSPAEVRALLELPVEGRATAARVLSGAKSAEALTLQRIDVYAADARVYVQTGEGRVEVPRSDWRHFIGISANGDRIALSMTPDGRSVTGVRFGRMGDAMVSGTADARGGIDLVEVAGAQAGPDGEMPFAACAGERHADPKSLRALERPFPKGVVAIGAMKVANRQAVIAVDTDNEFLQQRFNNNTTTATNFLAALFAGMNLTYEDDPGQNGLQLRLLQGDVTLRPSTTTDPFTVPEGGDAGQQLNEFGEFWRTNRVGVPRVLAMQLSGKSTSPNSALGLAWLLTSGNYCTATGQVFSGGTFGHYSISRLYTFTSNLHPDDVSIVAHELGHNFGANHTHCTDTSGAAGLQPIDTCFSGEGSGCYSGPESCPSSGPGAPQGTLMSYCHLSNANCGTNDEFHPFHVSLLDGRIDSQPNTCITPLGGGASNQPPVNSVPVGGIAVTEDVATSLTGISFSDPDAGSGSVTATFSVPAGSITAQSVTGITVGGTATARTLSGTLSMLNSYLLGGNVRYTTAPNVSSGTVNLTVQINDNGNSGTGGAQSDSDVVPLNVQPANDAPTLTGPSSLFANEDTATGISGFTLADVDNPPAAMTMTFSVPTGAMNATAITGITVGGTESARTLSGTLSLLSSYLMGGNVTYTGAPNATAPTTITVVLSDNGQTGAGGTMSAQVQIPVTINAVNDAPVLTLPASYVVSQDSPSPLEGIAISDVDAASGPMTLSFAVTSGTLGSTMPTGVTVTGAPGTNISWTGTLSALNAALAATPPTYTGGDTTLTVTINDGGNTGSGGARQDSEQAGIVAGILFRDGFE